MKIVARLSFRPMLRFSCIAIAWILLSGQASPPTPQRFSFPHKNTSDLRGILNVFSAFRHACLEQPVTRDLPARFVPDGYQIVTPEFHWWGKDRNTFSRVAILSKTGTEENDFIGGHPIFEITMPDDKRPNGHCSVVWKRSWDYADKHVPKIMFDMAAQLDAQISYRLEAVLLSVPDVGFRVSEKYLFHSDWRTACWDDNTCKFSLTASLNPEKGIELTLSRSGLSYDETEGQK